jgi:pyruvate,orthophosphate dikinase
MGVSCMAVSHDICSLGYFAGTLATAYRGTITSLVAKDFCMSGDDPIVVRGTVLAMPEGDYEASLVRSGAQLARAVLAKGYFELRVPRAVIEEARELQIDILQAGRHIGTFLLKQERTGGSYRSAVELSEDIAGADLQRLTAPIRGQVGLLRRAEEIIAQIHSTKKDWSAFSEKLNSFAIDVFWSAPVVFYGAFDLLAQFLLVAAENANLALSAKPVFNYVGLLALPLDKEQDRARLTAVAETWTGAVARSTVDLSVDAKGVIGLLSALRDRLPGADPIAVLAPLGRGLRRRVGETPFLDEHALSRLAGVIPRKTYAELGRFGAPAREQALRLLDAAEQLLRRGDGRAALEAYGRMDTEAFNDRSPMSALFAAADKHLSAQSADAFGAAAADLLGAAEGMSSRAREIVRQEIPAFLQRLAGLALPAAAGHILGAVEYAAEPLRGRIMLDPRTAKAVAQCGSAELTARYRNDLRAIAIPAARVRGISEDTWAEIVDPLHLERLDAFLDLLMEGGDTLGDLLAQVTANVAAGQVMIPDDRLFQRRISAYLGSPAMQAGFLLNYLLLERFPAYFNNVGATDRIRDHSTLLDSAGNDTILYFLRKQIHVNASSRNIELIERVLRSWTEADPGPLRGAVPRDILEKANRGLLARYAVVARPFLEGAGALDGSRFRYDRLLSLSDREIEERLAATGSSDNEALLKTKLLCELYKDVVRKYTLVRRDAAPVDARTRLAALLPELRKLKATILAPGRTEPQESLYFKRHIAFGIPSVLGSYREARFDALGDMVRIGQELPVLLEQVITETIAGDDGPGSENAGRWIGVLRDAWEALKLYGMRNRQIDEFSLLLASAPLSASQIMNVLRMWQRELAAEVASLGRTFEGPVVQVLNLLPREDLPAHLQSPGRKKDDETGRAADAVLRDILSSVPGLVESDRLLESLIHRLRAWSGTLPGHASAGGSDAAGPDSYDIHALTQEEAIQKAPQLGSKAKNLVLLHCGGFRVPAGVVLPASRTADYGTYTESEDFRAVLRKAVTRIEGRTGASFGGSGRPLFLAVRSGSYPSMPGILSSILYCGMNNDTVKAFAEFTGDERLAWDSYLRFVEHFAADVAGLSGWSTGNEERRQARSVPQLQALVERFRSRLATEGHPVPDDPYEQLRLCVRAVYASWYSSRAVQYRAATGTSEDWGTAVILMEMVPGNRPGAGASMFFTRDPATLEPGVFGESLENVTGDDIASGRLSGLPLSRAQAGAGHRSVEEADPELYAQHLALARAIEASFGGLPQEVEATYTRDSDGRARMFVLQTRRMEPGGGGSEAFAEVCGMERRVIGRGIGANGGALSGVVYFGDSPPEAEALGRQNRLPVILLRRTANTDDISLMSAVKGIITAAGGVTSHAAVLAQKFGLVAVVSCGDMSLTAGSEGSLAARFGDLPVHQGDAISIDGVTGLVFRGSCFETVPGREKETASR